MTDQELDNQEIDNVDNSLDDMFNEEQEQDYKTLYEQEKSRVEKISTDYKAVQADANRYKDATAKMVNTLKTHGVGDLDESGNLIIYSGQKPQQELPKEQIIDNSIKTLKDKYQNGEIDIEEYSEQISDLKAEKKAEQLRRELQEERKREMETKGVESKVSYFENLLNNEFPDHGNTESQLFAEMAKLFKQDAAFEDANEKSASGLKTRLLLARTAKENLAKRGIEVQKTRRSVVNNNFQTMDSRDVDISEKQDDFTIANDIGTRFAVERIGLNKKDVSQINKMVSNWNRDGSMTIEI